MARRSLLAIAVLCLAGCATTSVRPFPLRAVMWSDDDQRLFAPRPEGFYSPYMWDGADNAFFRPVAEFWRFETPSEAINVNALDEVPSSSWFTNRLSVRTMTPAEVARGACPERFEMPGPWTIVGGKPDGSNPGFQIRDANGVRYLLKTEGVLQPWRPGAADTIVGAMYHAAGYFAPCNRVVHFDPAILERDPEATVEHSDGREEPLTQAHVDAVLAAALRLPDGRYRAGVSRFVDGRPISAWRYEGVDDADPNDVVPHEHRRELRGMFVLAAWVDHIDQRQENTLAAWMTPDDSGAGYVRHVVIDFGDSLGIIHPWESLVRRFGHSGYIDFEHVLVDFLTAGLISRPWEHARRGPVWPTLGHYDVFRFEPDQWRPGYPNPAFDRHTERDAAWMARIVARFEEPHLRALVEEARFYDPVVESELIRILMGRRERILERYLTRLAPLTWPRVEASPSGHELCLQDLATWSGIRPADSRRYAAHAFSGAALSPTDHGGLRRGDDHHVCVLLPQLGGSPSEPIYAVVDVVAQTPGQETTAPARVHLYSLGDDWRVVGLERPATSESPRP